MLEGVEGLVGGGKGTKIGIVEIVVVFHLGAAWRFREGK